MAPLAHHGEPFAVPGEDRDRARMLHDVAGGVAAIAANDIVHPDADGVALPDVRAAEGSLFHRGILERIGAREESRLAFGPRDDRSDQQHLAASAAAGPP